MTKEYRQGDPPPLVARDACNIASEPIRVMMLKPTPLPPVEAIEPGFVRDEQTGRIRRSRAGDRLKDWWAGSFGDPRF